MNSYSRPELRLLTVASVIFLERIFMVLHSDVSVGLYLRKKSRFHITCEKGALLLLSKCHK
ncbi:hypothetical protein ALC57_16119 [Trachymyrmex cornetzi]|uniref:Uncharacterized protein n=1 Tax=Trachymyrmex cornetzi TaxID=471704 RepID=A0A151IVI9_9HYME|nr:hypothetical protein ALC57_16119 [Trachymyrmex cornetzi]